MVGALEFSDQISYAINQALRAAARDLRSLHGPTINHTRIFHMLVIMKTGALDTQRVEAWDVAYEPGPFLKGQAILWIPQPKLTLIQSHRSFRESTQPGRYRGQRKQTR